MKTLRNIQQHTLRRRALSLIEMLIAMTMMVTLATATVSAARLFVVGSARLQVRQRTQADLQMIITRIRDELRTATKVHYAQDGVLVFSHPDADGDLSADVVAYTCDVSGDQRLMRQLNSDEPAALLENVQKFVVQPDSRDATQPGVIRLDIAVSIGDEIVVACSSAQLINKPDLE